MSYTPGEWVQLKRSVDGGREGEVGKITSTGFLGDLDVHLESGNRVSVNPDGVRPSGPGRSSSGGVGDLGCASVAVALAAGAAALAGALGAASGWWA